MMKDMLQEYGEYTLSGINQFIPDKEPKAYLYDLMHDYPNRGGKGFRPGLCIATCKTFCNYFGAFAQRVPNPR